MSPSNDKENIAQGLVVLSPANSNPLSQKRSIGRKTRSKSIGPGGIDVPLKETGGNRRNSAFPAAVIKPILSREHDSERREERRKSLAKRRVSFAAEATLHTWDVIEYVGDLCDGTSSSSSSNPTERASSKESRTTSSGRDHQYSRPDLDPSEPLSTPPEQIEDNVALASPQKQRDIYQEKHRHGFQIPPMHRNPPEDQASFSPYKRASTSEKAVIEKNNGDDDYGSTMMNLDIDDVDFATALDESLPASSHARLSAGLREAAKQETPGQLKQDEDDQGDASMEIAGDEITAAFQPWAKRNAASKMNANPLDTSWIRQPGHEEPRLDEDEDGNTGHSVTFNGPWGKNKRGSAGPQNITLDLEEAYYRKDSTISSNGPGRRSAKRSRRSILPPATDEDAKPTKRQTPRRGGMQEIKTLAKDPDDDGSTMDFTVAIGGIKTSRSKKADNRRESTNTCFGDESMDLTLAMGGIQNRPIKAEAGDDTVMSKATDGDVSMELTAALGNVLGVPEAPSEHVNMANIQKSRKPGRASRIPTSRTPLRTTSRASMGSHHTNHARNPGATQIYITPQRRTTPLTRITPQQAPQNQTPARIEVPFATPTRIGAERRSLTSALLNTLRELPTPQKQINLSPLTTRTPLNMHLLETAAEESPCRRKVKFGENSLSKASAPDDNEQKCLPQGGDEQNSPSDITLGGFLRMAGIDFLDLSATKRRHTAHWIARNASSSNSGLNFAEPEDKDDLEACVVAAVSIVPEHMLYHHSCSYLREKLADGMKIIQRMEGAANVEIPGLFRVYMSATAEERVAISDGLKSLRTNARLVTRRAWYEWRKKLLGAVKSHQVNTVRALADDGMLIKKWKKVTNDGLPKLRDKRDSLRSERERLQGLAKELSGPQRRELDAARGRLLTMSAKNEDTLRRIDRLRQELDAENAAVEAANKRKIECEEQLAAAERTLQKYRVPTVDELTEAEAKVSRIEETRGWKIVTARAKPTIRLTLQHGDLEISFDPSAFAGASSHNKAAPAASTDRSDRANDPIELRYVGQGSLSTTQCFFLQALCANLHALPQVTTRARDMLDHVVAGWDWCNNVCRQKWRLNVGYPTKENILDDEHMELTRNITLVKLRSSVSITFQISLHPDNRNCVRTGDFKAEVKVSARRVYGEKYLDNDLDQLLQSVIGPEVKPPAHSRWANAVAQLEQLLIEKSQNRNKIA